MPISSSLITHVVKLLCGVWLFVSLSAKAAVSSADLLPSLQSGFRPAYSTETGILRRDYIA